MLDFTFIDFITNGTTNGIIPIIAAIVAAILGFLVSELGNWYRNKKAREEKTQSVRTLISLEIEKNIELITKFRNYLDKTNETLYDADKITLSRLLIKRPMPSLDTIMWKKQGSFLPIAFTEEEIISISKLNNYLEALKSIHAQLTYFDAEDRKFNSSDAASGRDIAPPPKGELIEKESPTLWDDFQKITKNIIENGNPLKKK
jgi:hypothetical protein